MSTMTIELESGLVAGLNRLAERLADSPAHIAQQAIQHFIELNEWQINEIEAAPPLPTPSTAFSPAVEGE